MPKGRLDEARRTCRFGWRLSILCIGANPDDIEIGATILGWIDRGVHLEVHWAVLSAYGSRTYEAAPRTKSRCRLPDTGRSLLELRELDERPRRIG